MRQLGYFAVLVAGVSWMVTPTAMRGRVTFAGAVVQATCAVGAVAGDEHGPRPGTCLGTRGGEAVPVAYYTARVTRLDARRVRGDRLLTRFLREAGAAPDQPARLLTRTYR